MSTTITLPAHLRDIHILAGIEFVDGSATVPTLGSHSRRFFELVGAFFTDPDSTAFKGSDELAVETMKVGDKLLTDCTVPELRDLAKTEGIDIPAKATKPEILHVFLVAFQKED